MSDLTIERVREQLSRAIEVSLLAQYATGAEQPSEFEQLCALAICELERRAGNAPCFGYEGKDYGRCENCGQWFSYHREAKEDE